MEDTQIIDLYWQRDEAAIAATQEKYGLFCHRIAKNMYLKTSQVYDTP